MLSIDLLPLSHCLVLLLLCPYVVFSVMGCVQCGAGPSSYLK